MQDDLIDRLQASASSSWEIAKQLLRRDRQSHGNLDNVLKRDIAFPTLHAADVIAMKSRSLCKLLLGKASISAKRSYGASKPGFDRLRGHLSSFRDDHYESTHHEWYLFFTADSRNRPHSRSGCADCLALNRDAGAPMFFECDLTSYRNCQFYTKRA